MLTVYLGLFLSMCELARSSNEPIVTTSLGKLLGWEGISRSGRTYQSFTNVPFGKPPVGNWRLKAPRPVSKWLGVYNATGTPPHCMQIISGEPWVEPTIDVREDCLYLNVFRPKETHNKSIPVLVYILGGANMSSMKEQRWHPGYLMDYDIVLVEPFFRVNAFGLLSLGDDVIPGNFMYKDQALALKWIKDNISSFGGNPDRVIVLGESSGAIASHSLLYSPLTRDLVHGGISYSGVINHSESLPVDDRTKHSSINIINSVNCMRNTSAAILDCLQRVDANDLLYASAEISDPCHLMLTAVVEPKSVEGAFFIEDPSLHPSDKPWIVSFTNGEYVACYIPLRLMPQYPEEIRENVIEHIENWLKDLLKINSSVTEKAEKIVQRYSLRSDLSLVEFTYNFSKMNCDQNFVYSSLHNAIIHNGPKWVSHHEYRADQETRATYPFHFAGHSTQTDLVFNRTGSFSWSPQPSDRDIVTSKRFLSYLINFIYHGDPTPKGSPYNWKQFKTNEIYRITKSGDFHGDQQLTDDLFDIYAFWKDIIGW